MKTFNIFFEESNTIHIYLAGVIKTKRNCKKVILEIRKVFKRKIIEKKINIFERFFKYQIKIFRLKC